MYYENLDKNIREYMLQELENDILKDALYISKRLTPEGEKKWPEILREAFKNYDDKWIAENLRSNCLMHQDEFRYKANGQQIIVKVPDNAPDTLAEGEFNRFYIRGLCVYIISIGDTEVEVYRGKEVSIPRESSERKIGKRLQAKLLLEDLRNSQGIEPALGLPSGPNSGLTVRRVQ
jgi:hypothetical protein